MISAIEKTTRDTIDIVKQTTLRGDKSCQIYKDARVVVNIVPTSSLMPMALYALRNRLIELAGLEKVLNHISKSIFSLNGLLLLNLFDSEVALISPPLIEKWNGQNLIVDGLHRVLLARMLKLERISVILVENVDIDLVAYPCRWSEVTICDSVPSKKRNYRFSSPSQLQAEYPRFAQSVNDNNYRYYLYRDLEMLLGLDLP